MCFQTPAHTQMRVLVAGLGHTTDATRGYVYQERIKG